MRKTLPLLQLVCGAGLICVLPLSSAEPGPELIKDPAMKAPGTAAWLPHGAATLTKVEEAGAPALKVETVRRGSPNGQCGIRGEIGAVAAGDVVRVELTCRATRGGGLTLFLGPSMNYGLGLGGEKEQTLVADVPARIGGNWGFWLLQGMNQRRGEIIVKRFSVRITEHGDPARFPIVTDGDMEQPSAALYSAYNQARIEKTAKVVRSGQRSLHVVSYDDDRPGSVYAGVACNFGTFAAKTRLKVSFDIKVASGTITPMLTRGAFDKAYEAIGPGDWQHVELAYETPLHGWYSIIWTRTADTPFEFWLDNVVCTVVK